MNPACNPEDAAPVGGEVRFYKKHHCTPSRDVMIRVNDCGHNRWTSATSATSADKARKGILRLERRETLRTLHHCGTCQGGGVWRVKW